MENQVERGKSWLEKVLALMGMPATAISEGFETIPEDLDSCWLNIEAANLSPEQSQLLIGEKGHNIDALQYLANTLLNINREQNAQGSYTIELDGYRVKRYQELTALLDQATTQVRETGQEVEISDLSSAERRQIHSFLQNSEDLATESRGQEPHRKLIVKLR
ncbi:putative RNA-binding protein [Xenococcus sp. PCC 7305]|uniref:Jag family protein n=1 Tax=Xenococcus sp. PCC 7305 TaxID=102125 RepID=UPI0002AC5E69|nr:R3H domain-containing nucleic acid-binding protein [Xenococcus sp. PCC 7305]ELS01979.1 putative RNA-binding protein [Xenococcus sp. PCC 7305]